MPTLLSQGIVHNLRQGINYALPWKEVIINSEKPLEYSNNGTDSWTPVGTELKIPYASQVIADGAVAYWRLNESSGTVVKSMIAGVPDGAISGSPTLNVDGALIDGDKCMSFDGAAEFITVPNGSYLAIGTGPLSVELWIRTTNSIPALKILDCFYNAASNTGFDTNYQSSTSLYFRIGNGTISDALISTTPILNDSQWHHIVFVLTRGASDTMSTYTDGILRGSKIVTTTGLNIGSPNSLLLAARLDAPTNRYIGDMDEVAIYKVALTPTQIANHYAARTIIPTSSPSYPEAIIADRAVAYWRLDETSGTTVKSIIAGVPDGTISGAVTLGVNGALSDNNSAMSFNPGGAADGGIGINVGNYSAIGIGSGSIECWMRIAAVPTGIQMLFGTTTFNTGPGLSLRVDPSNIILRLRDTLTTLTDVSTSITPVIDGNWHQVIGILRRGSPNDILEIWIDGILKNQSAPFATGRDCTATANSLIGAQATAVEFTGLIDECAIYKTALTPAQIQNHYNARLTRTQVPVIKGGFVRSPSTDSLFICKS